MKKKSIKVQVLESTPDFIKVQLPFLQIPVKMNYDFFRSRIQDGYFKLNNERHSTRRT